MRIRPLFWTPQPLSLIFPVAVAARLRHEQPMRVHLDDNVLNRLQYEVWAFAGALHVIRGTADQKAVIQELDIVARRAVKVLQAPSQTKTFTWTRKLCEALRAPVSNNADPARRAAIDYVALKYLTLEYMKRNRPLSSVDLGPPAHECLARQEWTTENLTQLCQIVAQLRVELARDNEETREIVGPLIGKPLVSGNVFDYRPDPLKEKRARSEDLARAAFAGQLVLLYRWMNGDAKMHKFGTGDGAAPATDFMKFLTAIAAAIPLEYRPKGAGLHRCAQTFLDRERLKRAA